MFPIWAWILLIIAVGVVICLLTFLFAKRKQIASKIFSAIKPKSRQERHKKKLQKREKQEPKIVKKDDTNKQDEKLSFEETRAPIASNAGPSIEGEVYEPSGGFNEDFRYTKLSEPQRRRTFNRENFSANRNIPSFIQDKRKETIKEQIQNLSPEMKAIIFANVLDSKIDDEDKF